MATSINALIDELMTNLIANQSDVALEGVLRITLFG